MFKIQPYTSKQLASYYGVSYRVFLSWVKEIKKKLGLQIGKTWNPKQIEVFIKEFGTPSNA